jgi:hypothetical protein
MIIPRFVNETGSNARGIVAGWYAVDDDGDLSSGPFAGHAECVRNIIRPRSAPILYVYVPPRSAWTCLSPDETPPQLRCA